MNAATVVVGRKAPPRPLADGEVFLALEATPSSSEPNVRALSDFATDLPTDLVSVVDAWVGELATDLSLEARAILENQVPFLASWATYRLAEATRLVDALSSLSPARVVLVEQHPARRQLEAFCAHAEIPFSTEFVGDTASRGRRLPKWRRLLPKRETLLEFAPAWRRTTPLFSSPLLVVSLQSNSTRAFLPVATALARRGVRCRFLLAQEDTVSQQLVREAGFDFTRVGSPLAPRSLALIASVTRALRARLTDSNLGELIAQIGFPISVDPRALLAELRGKVWRQLLLAIPRGVALSQALEGVSASGLVFITHRALLGRLLSHASGIRRSIFYLQGIVPDVPALFAHLEQVDCAIVGSELDADYARRCQIREGRLHLVGYADYQEFGTLQKRVCEDELRHLFPQARRANKLYVFCSQYRTPLFPDSAREANLHVWVQTAQRLPDDFFLIKIHPRRERLDPDLVQSLPPNVAIDRDFSTPRAIKGADALVTYWSTTALEAILLGTPLVQLNATGLPDYLELSRRLDLPVVRSSTELVSRLQDPVPDLASRYTSFKENYGLDRDTHPNEEAARLIADLIR